MEFLKADVMVEYKAEAMCWSSEQASYKEVQNCKTAPLLIIAPKNGKGTHRKT